MLKKIFALFFSLFSTAQAHYAQNNGIEIWYETFGSSQNPPLLLIMGGCCQGVIWHDCFCEQLAKDFYVIRYDHRDTGLSSCVDFAKNPYTLLDTTQDAIAILDALDIKKTHILGLSMGSLIAECMAAHYPDRVSTLTLMSSSPDIRPMNLAYANLPPAPQITLSPPLPSYLNWMNEWTQFVPQNDEEKLAQRLEGWEKLNGDKIPLNDDLNRSIHQKFLSRNLHPQAIFNHISMLRDPRSEELVRTAPSKITAPTTIIQGSEDPIYPPDHGANLHRLIPHSTYILIHGMGHVPNDQFFDLYISLIKQQASP